MDHTTRIKMAHAVANYTQTQAHRYDNDYRAACSLFNHGITLEDMAALDRPGSAAIQDRVDAILYEPHELA